MHFSGNSELRCRCLISSQRRYQKKLLSTGLSVLELWTSLRTKVFSDMACVMICSARSTWGVLLISVLTWKPRSAPFYKYGDLGSNPVQPGYRYHRDHRCISTVTSGPTRSNRDTVLFQWWFQVNVHNYRIYKVRMYAHLPELIRKNISGCTGIPPGLQPGTTRWQPGNPGDNVTTR